MELTQSKMYEVTGGAAWHIFAAVGAALAFIVGLVSGYTNPSKCNN